jgi:hypothetical protein
MAWSDVTRRVVVEAAAPHPHDVVFQLGGDWLLAGSLAARVARVVVRAPGTSPSLPPNVTHEVGEVAPSPVPEGTSVVVVHDTLRRLPPDAQDALLRHLGRALPRRALLVIGDVMWSVPPEQVDEPEQFGDDLRHAPTTSAVERMVRAAGFLPDIHRFGVGRAVCIALRS